jgi:hypothetical protein
LADDDYVKKNRQSGGAKGAGRAFKGEGKMSVKICWLDELAKAQEVARRTNRPILLDFFNPN